MRVRKRAVKNSNSPRVAIVGARGYSGLELARLLLAHPAVELAAVSASCEFELEQELLEASGTDVPFIATESLLDSKLDVVFLATPAESSLDLAPKFIRNGASVVDLSGAFRLKAGGKAAYRQWYGLEHHENQALARAEYGLRPWAGKLAESSPVLIANPGCYATSVLMAILPLLRSRLIDPASLVIDAKSGATGAGKKASEELLFSEVADECRPYKIGAHQHLPEIREWANVHAGTVIDPMFTTHLLPIRRGIVASVYGTVMNRDSDAANEERISTAFDEFYRSYPLLRHATVGSARGKALLSLHNVTGTPFTHIAYAVKNGRLYLFSLLDNLLKGAASQAVENLNCIIGRPVETGLLQTLTMEVAT